MQNVIPTAAPASRHEAESPRAAILSVILILALVMTIGLGFAALILWQSRVVFWLAVAASAALTDPLRR